MTQREWVLTAILVLLVSVGLPLIKIMTVSAQAEPLFVESQEYLTALKLAESDVRMNCFAFKTFWLTLFPDAKCYRYKTNIGTMHWSCELGDKLIIESNYRLDNVIRIRQK